MAEKQYPDLVRVTGYGDGAGLCGWNCRHSFFPVLEGIDTPTYTQRELESIDPTPVEHDGKTYTYYQATQKQRQLETAMRRTKRSAVAAEASGDKDAFTQQSVRLRRQKEKYKDFSEKSGLLMQNERAQVYGFDRSVSAKATNSYRAIAKNANLMYNTGTETSNVNAYMRDLPIRRKIQSNSTPKNVNIGRQNKHIKGTHEYNQHSNNLKAKNQYGPAYVTVDSAEINNLVNKYAGTGILKRDNSGKWRNTEIITVHPDNVGKSINNLTGAEADTSVFMIKYSSKGTHIVPYYPSSKGTKATK